jgi:membrane protease YdiL (CAAX protease family)
VTTTSRPPADWYPDPSGDHELRWWDGERWTDGVTDGEVVGRAPLDPAGAPAAWEERRDPRAPWPGWVALAAVAGMAGGVALAVLLATVVDAAGGGRIGVLVGGIVGLYGTLLGTCLLVGRTLGTPGGLFTDFGLRIRLVDLAWGLLLGLVARVASTVVVLVLTLVDDDLGGTNLPSEEAIGGQVGLAVAFFLMAVVGAPVVEEIFFRGLVQRSLETSIAPWAAIAVASVLFGLAHASIDLGPGNVSIVVATAVAGAVFGIAVRRFRRLGPAIAAHAWFNLPAAVAIFWAL